MLLVFRRVDEGDLGSFLSTSWQNSLRSLVEPRSKSMEFYAFSTGSAQTFQPCRGFAAYRSSTSDESIPGLGGFSSPTDDR